MSRTPTKEYVKIERHKDGFKMFEANGKGQSIIITHDFDVTVNGENSKPYVCLMTPKFYDKIYPTRQDRILADYVRSLNLWGRIKWAFHPIKPQSGSKGDK